MTHRYHPNPEADDPEDAVLYDDCEDCDQRAGSFTSLVANLDDENLHELWDMLHLALRPRTKNEAAALRQLAAARRLLQRVEALELA